MIPNTKSLVIYVLLLCGLEEAVLSQHRHCAGDQCFELFQRPEDFQGARKSCKDLNGQLLTFTQQHVEKLLSGAVSGSYWLELPGADNKNNSNCSSISVSTARNWTLLREPCSDRLSGFLCQYTLVEPCGGLRNAGAGAQVTYTAANNIEMKHSDLFQTGTVALAGKVGAKYPDSKHVCVSGNWLPAPWSCEVLGGGCERDCNSVTSTCSCPAGQALHPNKISCIVDPCSSCQHQCLKEGDTYACSCRPGYRLAADGSRCVDVDECAESGPCTGEGEECWNTRGSFQCRCRENFEEVDGVCEDISICLLCEHMLCDKVDGAFACLCRKGFEVSAEDKTKCEVNCTERDCPARCLPNPDAPSNDMLPCYCKKGYIKDMVNNTVYCTDINECENEMCDQVCENSFGSYRCLCDKGFRLEGTSKCVPTHVEEWEDRSGSGYTPLPPHPTPARSRPSAVPSYVKAGSVLGIAVFVALCALLLVFLVHNMTKRCQSFNLPTVKRPDIDIFYLQQVTTETYKKLPFNKHDSQLLQLQP